MTETQDLFVTPESNATSEVWTWIRSISRKDYVDQLIAWKINEYDTFEALSVIYESKNELQSKLSNCDEYGPLIAQIILKLKPYWNKQCMNIYKYIFIYVICIANTVTLFLQSFAGDTKTATFDCCTNCCTKFCSYFNWVIFCFSL